MSKKSLYPILLAFLLIVIAGCSVEKNTRVNRAYHNLTAHYNILFNGKESLKSGVSRINETVEDDYTKMLLVYKSSDPGTGQTATSEMETAIMKASKLIKLHSITKKPKRRKRRSESYKKFASKEEFNKWVDDSYLLMGQSYFYMKNYISAIENFSFVLRKFSEEDTKYDALVWLVRAYTEMERYNEALETIQNIDGDEDFPKRLNDEFALAVAHFHIKQNEYEEAIPHMRLAVKSSFLDKNKARYKYILAQLYQETGNEMMASETFREVARMNPPYIMAFNARINAAGTFTGEGDIDKLKKDLRKMLKDVKNLEFRDQIYYALADIFLAENNKATAVDMYKKSAASSSVNMYQRALSCLTLADIYFEEQNYEGAQSYYDSAMVVIDENYPDYKTIQSRYQSLSRLVENLSTVVVEDSLQRIALLSDAERTQLVTQWIKEAQEEEERLRQLENAQMLDRSFFRMNQNRFGLNRQQQGSGWYFYNPTTVAYGKSEFERLWGKRSLEDDWRRGNKSTSSDEDFAELEGEGENGEEVKEVRVEDPKNREYYLQDVPLTDKLMEASHERIRDALFNAGRIFKQDYSNFQRSIDSYEDLIERYPENIYQLTALFELWDLYGKIENPERSNYYKNLVINSYPESKYAKYLINPNYFIELEARKDSLNNLYQQAFYNYSRGNYQETGRLVDQMLTMEPDSLIEPKIDFLGVIADGTQTDWTQFGRLLIDHTKKYPTSATKPLAEDILELISDSTLADYQKLIEIGYLNETIQNEELMDENLAENDEFGGKFSYDEDLLHYFVIAYPRRSGVDINRLKFDIANYNIDHYTKIDFDIEIQNLSSDQSLLTVRALEDKQQSLIYFRSIIRQREVFETLADVEYINFMASSYNYREITSDRNYTEYLKFFIKNYSKFISSDFPEDELEDPEELMAKAREEEEQLEERGTFVVVKADANQEVFEKDFDKPQNLVIAVKDRSFDLRTIMGSFANYNRDRFAGYNLTMQQRAFGDYQLLVIKHLPNTNEAMDYFSKVVANRKLYEELETRSYRNFVISDKNLNDMIADNSLDEYIKFFRKYHIRGNYSKPTSEVVQPTTKEEKQVEQTSIEIPVQTEPEKPKYEGIYTANVEGNQRFVLIVPNQGINKESLKSAIQNFNNQNFTGLSVDEQQFGEDLLLSVSGLSNKDQGMNYLSSIIQNQQIYGQLAELNYRNFVITEENFTILLDKKDVADYINLFKALYLNL